MSDWWHGEMEAITQDAVRAEFNKRPRRRCVRENDGLKSPHNYSIPFRCQKRIFEAQTGLFLEHRPEYESYVIYNVSAGQREIIRSWNEKQGDLIFLRNCLSLSVALDYNLVDVNSGEYTLIGGLVDRGKEDPGNEKVVEPLATFATETINALPFYKDTDFICAVPSCKPIDLPGAVSSLVSEKTGKPNLTEGFDFNKEKVAAKSSELEAKWDVWEESKVSFKGVAGIDIRGKSLVLIDDLYQSGRTMQYVAMKLQVAGARQICGLSLVKTWGDKDNTGFSK